MAGEEGLGKASKARKHQAARTPYSRPKSSAGPSTDATPLLGNPGEAPGTAGKISYLGSVFSAATTPLRAAANNLINRVSLLVSDSIEHYKNLCSSSQSNTVILLNAGPYVEWLL
jgi:hypothetical protein